MRLLYYRPRKVLRADPDRFPGFTKFSRFFDIYGPGVVIVDRTATIRMPIKLKALAPLPAFEGFTKTYEEICDARAREILSKADVADVDVCVSWSGGIDSTLVLISLLKMGSNEQKRRIVVLLSEESITENPRFWEEHIHGKLRVDSSVLFSHRLGTKDVLLDGEHNDQLFGSDVVGKLIHQLGDEHLHKPYSRDLFSDFFGRSLGDQATTDFYLDLFERLKAAAPLSIETNFLYLWWINFALKWQAVHLRRLLHTAPRNIRNIDQRYIDTKYVHFFGTDDFQRWSMANPDKRIKDTWNTYKWPAKDIIYDYTKDREYRDSKIKRGSLKALFLQQHSYSFIDEKLGFHDDLSPETYYEPHNDFS
ncbi:MAG: hypothetical protein HYS26_01100 [Candidatus Kaiserbacteria bacterium]|nr:MAG: hypothetical protein HYS26_01100 [Candidatus Kaiserbacteria bacterium]